MVLKVCHELYNSISGSCMTFGDSERTIPQPWNIVYEMSGSLSVLGDIKYTCTIKRES